MRDIRGSVRSLYCAILMIFYEYDIDRYGRWPLLFSTIKQALMHIEAIF